MLQITKSILDSGHPYSKYSTGNMHTLAKGDPDANAASTRAVMQSFYHTYYRPGNMTLALVGPQPIPELKRLAQAHFGGITAAEETADQIGSEIEVSSGINEVVYPHIALTLQHLQQQKHHDSSTTPPPPYPILPQYLGKILRVRPVQEVRDLTLLWSIPSTR